MNIQTLFISKTIHWLTIALFFVCLTTSQQTNAFPVDGKIIHSRARVIIDNDFGGDPDGLFHLAQQLLSPSATVKAIVCSHHYRDFYRYPGNVRYAREQVNDLLDVMQIQNIPVYLGSDSSFTNTTSPLESEGARAIVKEAMKDDKSPLYILCGAGLTNIASAYLMNPEIANRIKAVVWIGGPEYTDLCRNQLQRQREYNLGIDPISVQVVFNHSTLPIWQFPRDVYRQALYSYAELQLRVRKSGKTGEFLMAKLDDLLRRAGGKLGEAYVLGDSPLALASSLQSAWEPDAASCEYVIRKTPFIDDRGRYADNPNGRPIRIFTKIDTRLMFEDFIAKLHLNNQ